MTRSAVELGHQLTVCGAGGFDVLVPFSEFAAKVENLLFQVGGAACERLDVGRGAEAGGFPSCLSQGLGQAPFEPGDVRGQLPITGREVRDVGQQRLAADLRDVADQQRGNDPVVDGHADEPTPGTATGRRPALNIPDVSCTSHPRSASRLAFERTRSTFADIV